MDCSMCLPSSLYMSSVSQFLEDSSVLQGLKAFHWCYLFWVVGAGEGKEEEGKGGRRLGGRWEKVWEEGG